MRWFAVIVVAGFAALVLTYYAGWDDAAAPPSQERTGVTAHTSPARLVRDAAEELRPVQSVVCHAITEESTFCAVTFVGPSCQLWEVTNGKPSGLPVIIDGKSGSKSKTGVRC